ncbi:Asp23/Gls24 family envelope stress response protein [Streptomyces sp. NBC_01754]|uniref:Asp23/Gls24 family envelope stress response protein n=1 Tax=Streptomyces sp. NBC_01754 TaxID=2975930 RepID=UPI002DD989E2|nr:Asp23/Gls24 family envelope stress response protein [Streptomyces sp. NBC_01754]WSC92579.1 Asp23/Gls24 family envelope stress response protein [Streptomyces sp. NBC_01754]
MADVGSQSGNSTADRNAGQSGKGGRGTTTIANNVVATIAGIAVRETEGVYSVGRGASKALGAVTGRMPGSSGAGRSVKVEVGEKETAIDVEIEVEYGVPIHELADRIRSQVTDAVQSMTGLRVVEININVFDVHVPDEDDEDNDDEGSRSGGQGGRVR